MGLLFHTAAVQDWPRWAVLLPHVLTATAWLQDYLPHESEKP